MDALRPFLSRIIAAGIAAFIGFIATKLGIDATSIDQAALATSLGSFLTLVIYSIAHRVIDKKVNPGDNASSHLAAVNKVKAANLKATDQTQQRGF